MRCTKCGKFLPLLTKFCQKCGQPVNPEQRKKSRKNFLLISLIGFAVVTFLIYLINLNPKTVTPDSQFYAIAMIVLGLLEAYFFIILLVILPIVLIKKIIALIKLSFKNPKFLPIPLAIILVIIGAGYFFYGGMSDLFYEIFYGTGQEPLYLVQDNLTSAAAIKIFGDAVKAGSPAAFTGKNDVVANAEQTIAQKIANLRLPAKLADYKKVATIWPGRIAEAAGDLSKWKDLPAQPADFTLTISTAKAKNYLQHTVEQLSLLKEFGDANIKRGDREAMAYLTAKLLVQEHWLNGLTHSNNSFLARLLTPVLAYSTDIRKICYQVKGKDICADEVKQIINDLYHTAYDYVSSKDQAATEWNKSWDTAVKDKGLPLEILASISVSKEQPKYSPSVQAFQDDCFSKGGSLNNAKPASDRLPTGESGYRCDYKSVALNCWNFLTYTGGSYGAGDDGCLQKNLLPKNIASSTKENNLQQLSSLSILWQKQLAATQVKAKTAVQPIKWDGTYPLTGTLKCTSQLPNLPPSFPVNDTLTVVNNAIINEAGKPSSINSQGQARLTVSQTRDLGSGVTLTLVNQINYQFTKTGSVLKTQGSGVCDGAIAANGQSIPIHCTGNVAGTKK